MTKQKEALSLHEQQIDSLLDGNNYAYLEYVYESYLIDPQTVPDNWRDYFDSLPGSNGNAIAEPLHSSIRRQFIDRASQPIVGAGSAYIDPATLERDKKQVRVSRLINAYRFSGHFKAKTNPLQDTQPDIPELNIGHYQLTNEDLDIPFNTGTLIAPTEMPLRAIIQELEQTYCGSIGSEYMHIPAEEERKWFQNKLESVRSKASLSSSQQRYLLERLTASEALERFLHTKYVGQKRFSLEGGESLIPMLDDILQKAGDQGVKESVIGMAHRGRLNVLVNILGKSPAELFKEFEGKNSKFGEDRTGDVKYHMGFSSDINTPGGAMHVAMAFNPSHLEIVGPVVVGSVRARQDRRGDSNGSEALPIIIHGDAAFAGQGVVMETLNMGNTRGFSTKGSMHIIVNNQIGFTTSTQSDARSTYYCTDVAKMINAPIFHVNGDDPEAVSFVANLALEYRKKFKKDVFIDLLCYRRHGHNEADEPAATQPVMYKTIRALPTTRALYARKLVEAGVLTEKKVDDMVKVSRDALEKGDPVVPYLLDSTTIENPHFAQWDQYIGKDWTEPAKTSVAKAKLKTYMKEMNTLPDGFSIHKTVQKIYNNRVKMSNDELPMDWGFCETLAYASLISEGHRVRLIGQDSGRGTFFHRHAAVHRIDDRERYVPLDNMPSAKAPFTVIDSFLSEEAVLAFEYGYSTTEPNALVLWEAQFGDFVNGAQVVIDQFISSGEQKWDRLSGLVMLLPHGYEGQGPEHSSARLERFLQLCAQHNMQVCVPSTPAQIFHMLRRQVKRNCRKPLIVMSPKSLLRHPLVTSQLEDLTEGKFHNVLPEIDELPAKKVTRVVMCSGKVYYDLLKKRREEKMESVALIRVEQLYPFPDDELKAAFASYTNVEEFVWCQEEPLNQGVWYSLQHHFKEVLADKASMLSCVSRPASASPAVGALSLHIERQKAVVDKALGLNDKA